MSHFQLPRRWSAHHSAAPVIQRVATCSASTAFSRQIHMAALLLATVVTSTALPVSGATANAATFGKARTSRAVRADALRDIPFDQLSPEAQQRIAAVVTKPTVFRRLPIQVVDCDASLYLFLVRNPEVVVNIWELMGITQIELQRTGPFTYQAADGMGTNSQVELVYGTKDLHLVYGEGTYDGPLLPRPVKGRCVLLLKSGYVSTAEGRDHVTNRLDVFLQLDHVALDVIAKTIHPLMGHTADMNFIQTVAFLGRVSRNSEVNAPGMQRLADRLTKVEPTVRQQFAEMTEVVASRSEHRLANSQSVVPASGTEPPARR
jgi:hypothetical protein